MNSNAIVTLADSNYFELLIELIDSINTHDKSKSVSVCVLDAGLTEEQNKIIKDKVYSIKKAEWDIEVPKFKVAGKEWLKSQVSRAFLPNYFPEFEKYLWIDCDAWVNSWESVELCFKACEKINKNKNVRTIHPGFTSRTKNRIIFRKKNEQVGFVKNIKKNIRKRSQ